MNMATATLTTTAAIRAVANVCATDADFCYTMTGGIVFPKQCAPVSSFRCERFRFAEGSIVFICDTAATKGRMEAIAIKKVELITDSFLQIIPIYIDTTNRRWNEDELCTQNEAKELALDYNERQLAAIEEQIDALCPDNP